MTLVNISPLREIAEVEFGEIAVDTDSPDLNELRIILIDGSFIDVWFSFEEEGGAVENMRGDGHLPS